jgi:hypothetical protein
MTRAGRSHTLGHGRRRGSDHRTWVGPIAKHDIRFEPGLHAKRLVTEPNPDLCLSAAWSQRGQDGSGRGVL